MARTSATTTATSVRTARVSPPTAPYATHRSLLLALLALLVVMSGLSPISTEQPGAPAPLPPTSTTAWSAWFSTLLARASSGAFARAGNITLTPLLNAQPLEYSFLVCDTCSMASFMFGFRIDSQHFRSASRKATISVSFTSLSCLPACHTDASTVWVFLTNDPLASRNTKAIFSTYVTLGSPMTSQLFLTAETPYVLTLSPPAFAYGQRVQGTYIITVQWEETPAWVSPLIFVVLFTLLGIVALIVIVTICGGGAFLAGYIVGRKYELNIDDGTEEERQSLPSRITQTVRENNPFRKRYQRV